MIGMLPVFAVVLALVAVGLQRRATTLFGDVGCPHRRPNHSLCPHAARRDAPQRPWRTAHGQPVPRGGPR